MTSTKCWSNSGPPSATLAQHQTSTGSTPRVCWAALNPGNTKHLYNICTMRRRRWAGVVQMLCKCFVFAWNSSWSGGDYKPTPTQCLLNVEPASPVLASKHSVLMSTLFVTICNRLRRFATICDRLRPFAIVLRPFATICDHLGRFATIYGIISLIVGIFRLLG